MGRLAPAAENRRGKVAIAVIKKLLLLLTAIVPFNRMRIFLYRLVAGYRISYDSRVGCLNYLDFTRCTIEQGRIGHFNIIRCQDFAMAPGSRIDKFNHIKNVHRFDLGGEAAVGTRNHFIGTRQGLTPFKEHENIAVGDGSIITVGHMFDLSDTVSIGSNVTFGGRGSEVWTHGFDVNHVKIQAPVHIGDDVYVGSRCLIIQSVRITAGVSLGAGTVVSKTISDPGFYVSSQLVRKSEPADYSQSDKVIIHKNARFVRK